jgi:TonB family protein
MKPMFVTIIVCALAAPTAWTQRVGACSSKSNLPEFETYCRALETNAYSSLAHYRIAELLYLQDNWQSAANEFREALNGNLDPKWTEVWARISLGKIFEITGQRDRALNEYRQARRTGDNTFAAQDEVTRLVEEMGVKIQPSPRILDPSDRTEPVETNPAEYTEEARIAELEGTVLLEGVIGEDGRAHNLTVLRPLGLGLDESAIAAVRQWLFMAGHGDGQPGSKRSVIAVDFFLSSKPSRWHLIRADFNLPSGGVRPRFLSTNYPPGAGVLGTASIDEGQLLRAMGRQATATVSFDINERGIPVNIQVGATSAATWGPEAAALVSEWRFKPGMKDGRAVSAPCSVGFIWGPRNLTAATVDRVLKAFVGQEIR